MSKFLNQKKEIYNVFKSSPIININTKEREIRYPYPITDNTSVGSGPDTDERVNEILTKEDGIIKCMTCGKTGNHSSTMKRHAETHLEGLSYSCPTCDKTFRYCNYKFIIQFRQQRNWNIICQYVILINCNFRQQRNLRRHAFKFHNEMDMNTDSFK